MKRFIYNDLLAWKNNPKRKPLVLQGARQVGKTYIVKEFGKNEFKNMLYVNCHNNPLMENLFSDFDVKRILYQLSQAFEQKIVPGETLIFFDEIQEVANGISSLKYFCEDARDVHVIVAGSLLGISLRENESYPVGKINDLRMYPMTFGEFLLANGREMLAASVMNLDFETMRLQHDTLVEYLRQYYFTGGMPEVVSTWLDEHDAAATRDVQRAILSAYLRDMGKHSQREVTRIHQVWNSVPVQLAKENKKFVFGVVRKGARSADFEKALQWLCDAGIVYKVERVLTPEEPLKIYADAMAFKVYLHDCGLLACMAGARPSEMLLGMKVFSEFKGSFTENYVLSQMKSFEKHDDVQKNIFYFSKDNSRQEVDYVVQTQKRVVPIEVKAEENVRSKSLKMFVDENKAQGLKAIRFSMLPYKDQDWMENYPLYAVEAVFAKLGIGVEK